MENYFIIHGSYGNNKENWFEWLENKLKDNGEVVYNFNYPTPNGQNFENWSKVLNKKFEEISEQTTFICHSISCMFVVKYCIQNNIKINKAIFVSGFNNYYFDKNFDEINKTMYLKDIAKFKDLCKETICIYSKDDPYVKLDYLLDFCTRLSAKKVEYSNAGHFNEKAGYKTFNDLLKFL